MRGWRPGQVTILHLVPICAAAASFAFLYFAGLAADVRAGTTFYFSDPLDELETVHDRHLEIG